MVTNPLDVLANISYGHLMGVQILKYLSFVNQGSLREDAPLNLNLLHHFEERDGRLGLGWGYVRLKHNDALVFNGHSIIHFDVYLDEEKGIDFPRLEYHPAGGLLLRSGFAVDTISEQLGLGYFRRKLLGRKVLTESIDALALEENRTNFGTVLRQELERRAKKETNTLYQEVIVDLLGEKTRNKEEKLASVIRLHGSYVA